MNTKVDFRITVDFQTPPMTVPLVLITQASGGRSYCLITRLSGWIQHTTAQDIEESLQEYQRLKTGGLARLAAMHIMLEV